MVSIKGAQHGLGWDGTARPGGCQAILWSLVKECANGLETCPVQVSMWIDTETHREHKGQEDV